MHSCVVKQHPPPPKLDKSMKRNLVHRYVSIVHSFFNIAMLKKVHHSKSWKGLGLRLGTYVIYTAIRVYFRILPQRG